MGNLTTCELPFQLNSCALLGLLISISYAVRRFGSALRFWLLLGLVFAAAAAAAFGQDLCALLFGHPSEFTLWPAVLCCASIVEDFMNDFTSVLVFLFGLELLALTKF